MSRMAKMKTEFQRMRDLVVSTNPASALDAIIDEYAKRGIGGQDRNVKPIFASTIDSEISSTAKSYMKAKMVPMRAVVGVPSGVVKTAEIPKQEYTPVGSSCDAAEERRRKESPPAYQKIIERIVKEGPKKDVVKEAQELFNQKSGKKDAA